jgi:IS5 family transposase
MGHQLSFADSEFNNKRRQTRKEKFLGRMETLIPWQRLEAVIEPHYPKPGNGRRPYGLSASITKMPTCAVCNLTHDLTK